MLAIVWMCAGGHSEQFCLELSVVLVALPSSMCRAAYHRGPSRE